MPKKKDLATFDPDLVFQRLLKAYGCQHWWPAQTPVEVAIGAILTQNTAWTNVERAIASLKENGLLDLRKLHEIDAEALAPIIRSAGTYRIKAVRLKAFADWVMARAEGDLLRALDGPTAVLRTELLAISGIGPETADAILLYAGNHPVFVIDTYTRRILRRHKEEAAAESYAAAQMYFTSRLKPDVAYFNEYHALLVELGKHHCRARAQCAGCPLEDLAHDELR